jgi:hypothetical protein
MSLENLFKINLLMLHQTSSHQVLRLFAAAERNLADSAVADLSDETRFDAAYKSIMQCAMLGLWAHGYRPSTTLPGHHQTMIQALGQNRGSSDVIGQCDAGTPGPRSVVQHDGHVL